MSKPNVTIELVDIRRHPKVRAMAELLQEHGFTNVSQTRTDEGIILVIEGKTYEIGFGEMISSNLTPGPEFTFRHYRPTADMYYALAA